MATDFEHPKPRGSSPPTGTTSGNESLKVGNFSEQVRGVSQSVISAGSIPAALSCHTVEGATWWPSRANSPWILQYPHPGFFPGHLKDQFLDRRSG